jgi:hypothetical protein
MAFQATKSIKALIKEDLGHDRLNNPRDKKNPET